ncbi:MAG: ABC transporter ATP-binding protein [Actinomycetota bacterium]
MADAVSVRVPAIEATALTRTFGGEVAVDGIDLRVDGGELFALLGPNGAGKTTTLRMLCGLLRPTSGSARILGHDVATDALGVKRLIAISPQETAVAEHLDAWENLALMAGVHGIDAATGRERSQSLLATLGLDQRADHAVKRYSGGMKRRLSIAMALVTDPEVVFLDEPTIGLDPQSRRGVWEYIAGLKRRVTIVLTTHYLEEADELADRLAIIDDGRVIALGTPDDLKSRHAGAQNLLVEATGWTEDALAALGGRFRGVSRSDRTVEVADSDATVQEVNDCLRPFSVGLTGVHRRPASLDDVFLELTGKELRP